MLVVIMSMGMRLLISGKAADTAADIEALSVARKYVLHLDQNVGCDAIDLVSVSRGEAIADLDKSDIDEFSSYAIASDIYLRIVAT